MATRHTRAMLMAGAATLSLSAAAFASEFGTIFVFGDRLTDAGQYVDSRTVFSDQSADEIETDGRGRFTNLQSDGNTGHTWSTLVSRNFGLGDTHPNQPQSLPNSPPVETGTNYAAGFNNAEEVLASINGTPRISGIIYSNGSEERIVPGTDGVSVLKDADRRALLADSLVMVNGGLLDVRLLANVERDLDGSIDLELSGLEQDVREQRAVAHDAADDISRGATLLSDAGAGLVVVTNLMDSGKTPEVPGDFSIIEEALDEVEAEIEELRSDFPGVDFTALEAEMRAPFEAMLANPEIIGEVRSNATDLYNARLASNLDGKSNIVVIDQNALYQEILDNPQRFGLSADTNPGIDCFTDDVLYPCNATNAPLADQLFLNGLDITTTFHEMYADQITGVINAPVQVSGLPFTAIASGREVANAGRSQVTPERIARAGWAPFVSAGIGSSTWNELSGEGKHGSQRISGVGGVTYSFGNGIAVGAAAGYQNTSQAMSGTTIEIEGTSIYGSVFAGADVGHFFGNASVTVGSVDYDSVMRQTKIGNATFENTGQTDGSVFGASVEVGARALTSNMIAAGPIASLDHWSADIGAYNEDGWAATGVNYDTALNASSTRASIGVFLEGGDLEYEPMPALFRVKALYTRELNTDTLDVTARAQTMPNNTFTRKGRGAQPDSLNIGAQLSYDFGPAIASLNYDVRVGESDDHSGSIDISIPLGGSFD